MHLKLMNFTISEICKIKIKQPFRPQTPFGFKNGSNFKPLTFNIEG